MEPFELKLHQVTFDESNGNLGQSQSQPQLDSLGSLVHYDANFQDKTGSDIQEGANLQELTFYKSGKRSPQASKESPLRTSTQTTTTPSQVQSPISSTKTTSSAGHSPAHSLGQSPAHSPPPWETLYLGDQEGQGTFLVNPDDNFFSRSEISKVSPESAAAGLRTLSQVSVNTTAIARHLRKSQGNQKGKRRVAKTTLTSTALVSPRTMPSETLQPSAAPSTPTAAPTTPGAAEEDVAGGVNDSSFETVAEALRLQWSVIGNSAVTPASPEEVARIVAEAEKRLRGDEGSHSLAASEQTSHTHPPGDTTAASDTISIGSLSSLSSLSSSTNDNGAAVTMSVDSAATHNFGSATVSGSTENQPPAELIRIPPQSITREVTGKTSWFQSKDKQTAPSQKRQEESAKSTATSSHFLPNREKSGGGGDSVERGAAMHGSGTNLIGLQAGVGVIEGAQRFDTAMAGGGEGETLPPNTSSHDKISSQVRREPPTSVPFGSGITSPPSDLAFHSPLGSTPYASPFSNTPTPPSEPGQQWQQASSGVSLHQQAATTGLPQQQPTLSHGSTSHPFPQSPGQHAEQPLVPTSNLLPMFNPNLVPIPQIGPLFPKKGGGDISSPQKWNPPSTELTVAGSVARRDGYDEVLREKLKMEGQLEVLQGEAQSTLQERAELQAQVASLQLKLKSGQQKANDAEKASLRAELERLRETRLDHEREALEVQQMLEEKLEELKAVTEDLYQSQDTVDKLQVRMKELRDDLQARGVTVQALKSKIAELYVEVQTTLQSKMEADSEARTARNDLVSLVKAKEWYQEQLSTAHEVRAKLQQQLTQLQAQSVAQGSIVERLKLESGRLRQQLRESQERALRDKEQLARHLETIQQDMMEREAAFQEIQRERVMIEDTFNTQVTTVEEEKSRITSLLQVNSELEAQLEHAHNNSKKRQEQVFALENEQMELMKRLTLAQEVLVEKEQLLEETNQKLIEVESQLEAFTKTLAAKDTELLKLREDKASTEIALKAALQEKESVDKALETLKADMGKVEKSFKQMRQELGTRSAELETAQTQQKSARDELDRVAHELDIKARSVETLTSNLQVQVANMQQLQAEKGFLEQQVTTLKRQVEEGHSTRPADEGSQQTLQTELHETRARLAEAENRLQVSAAQLQQTASLPPPPPPSTSTAELDGKLQAVTAEKDILKEQLEKVLEEQSQNDADNQRETEKLNQEVASLQSQLSEGKSDFEKAVQSYVDQLRAVTEEKERLETELMMTKRTVELSSVQQQEHINAEIQTLMKELEAAQLQKQHLEHQLLSLQANKDTEIAGLRQQLANAHQSLRDAEQQHEQHQKTEDLNQGLALELEKERGRIAGLQQSNTTLKEHMKQLEEALAGRESSLVELNTHLESSSRQRQKEQQESLRRIQELELALKKAKDSGRDLRKQIGSKITENKRLLKQQDTHKKEQIELQEVVERCHGDTARLQTDLERSREMVRDQQVELQTAQSEKHAAEVELDRVKRELADSADRNPVLVEQIQNLEWQVSQKSQEVQAVRDQLSLAEQRHANELDSLKRALQDKQEEVESLQAELAAVRQEKVDQKSRVAELRSVLKASVQHHKLTKKLNSRKKEKGGGDADGRDEKATQADMGNGIVIPPLPFEMDAVEQLLLDTAVKPLDSKPLDNLSTCLSSLRAEISGLQKQMEVHTTTIHSSTQSWRSVESEVKGLQEVVRSIANTIMDVSHTNTAATTTVAGDVDTMVEEDSGVLHL